MRENGIGKTSNKMEGWVLQTDRTDVEKGEYRLPDLEEERGGICPTMGIAGTRWGGSHPFTAKKSIYI